MKGSIVMCISPLIAIMKEQATKFSDFGLSSEFVGEGQTNSAVRRNGEAQLVFITQRVF